MPLAEHTLWLWAAVFAGVVAALALVLARDHLRPRNFGVVVPERIWRAGRLTPRTLRLLRDRHGIITVIDLGAYWPRSRDEARIQRAAADLGLTRHSIRGLRGDGTGNPNAYVHALQAMTHTDAGPLLVMCAAGADRTGACVAFYRVVVQGWTLDAALAESARHDHDADRNPAMHTYVREHLESIREAVRRGHAIPGHPLPDVVIDSVQPHIPAAPHA
jgi:protein tyrosine/serine phosphatase